MLFCRLHAGVCHSEYTRVCHSVYIRVCHSVYARVCHSVYTRDYNCKLSKLGARL